MKKIFLSVIVLMLVLVGCANSSPTERETEKKNKVDSKNDVEIKNYPYYVRGISDDDFDFIKVNSTTFVSSIESEKDRWIKPIEKINTLSSGDIRNLEENYGYLSFNISAKFSTKDSSANFDILESNAMMDAGNKVKDHCSSIYVNGFGLSPSSMNDYRVKFTTLINTESLNDDEYIVTFKYDYLYKLLKSEDDENKNNT